MKNKKICNRRGVLFISIMIALSSQNSVMAQSKQATQVVQTEQVAQTTEEAKETVSPTEAVVVNEKNNLDTQVVEESTLKGKIISIDAGHQAKGNSNKEAVAPGSSEKKAKVASGTKGVSTGKAEYKLNLEVALKLEEALKEKGAIVYMVRKTNDVDISNAQRAELANKVGADLSLRIHADAAESKSANGFSVLIPGTKYVDKEVVKTSKEIATYVEAALAKGITNKSRGIVTRNDLTGFNWSKVPAVLVEMGFMSNAEEDKRMSTEKFQKDLTQAIVQGLEDYFEGK